ncbi:hypothetical protein Shyhy01_00790 [Streptomyces hygroscopicus subsp. hygroscopicus]|nr:hypothetical protein Shyhy01_00790 [Streptomyces hygroscopicus subsp. hygroscopicus]
MSDVRVVVIDCTDTGAPPPTATGPTWIRRDRRRGATCRAGTSGTPRGTAVTAYSRFPETVSRMARSDSFSEPMVASTAVGS